MTKESEALATFLSACIDGEMNGDNMKKAMAEYVQPAWQDAPTCAVRLRIRLGRPVIGLVQKQEKDDGNFCNEGARWPTVSRLALCAAFGDTWFVLLLRASARRGRWVPTVGGGHFRQASRT